MIRKILIGAVIALILVPSAGSRQVSGEMEPEQFPDRAVLQ